MRAAALCAVLLLLQGASALELHGKPKDMTQKKCRVLCQRFGMKMLGKQFEGLHPTDCMAKCNEVYPAAAFLQVTPPAAPAAPVSKPSVGGSPATKK